MVGAGVTRRKFLAVGGGLAAMAVAGCGSNTGRESSGGSSGEKPALSQWYHQYGEAGTQQAVERYAKEYPDATVTVQWSPGDYDKKTTAALLTDNGPDVFEYGNGPTIDMIKGGQVVDLTDLLDDATKADFTPSLIKRVTYQDKLYAIPQVSRPDHQTGHHRLPTRHALRRDPNRSTAGPGRGTTQRAYGMTSLPYAWRVSSLPSCCR